MKNTLPNAEFIWRHVNMFLLVLAVAGLFFNSTLVVGLALSAVLAHRLYRFWTGELKPTLQHLLMAKTVSSADRERMVNDQTHYQRRLFGVVTALICFFSSSRLMGNSIQAFVPFCILATSVLADMGFSFLDLRRQRQQKLKSVS